MLVIGLVGCLLCSSVLGCVQQEKDTTRAAQKSEPKELDPEVRQIGKMQNKSILECSGIASSRLMNDHFWVHNDSGADAKVYLVNSKGLTICEVELAGVKNNDFEDIASFSREGTHYFAVADIGDNLRRRKELQLHLVKESRQFEESRKVSVKPAMTVTFEFEDKIFRDCEAVAYYPSADLFLVCSKPRYAEIFKGTSADLFSVQVDWKKKSQKAIAKKVGTVAGGLITGMDCSPDGKKLVVQNYVSANVWSLDTKGLPKQLTQESATLITLPAQRQSEAICFSNDGRKLITTSEGKNQAIYEIRLE